MPRDYPAQPYNEVRRRDRAVHDEAWIKLFLHRAPVGALATVHEGQPFINTNLFVYDEPEHVIYVHTARVGRTRTNVEQEERICFSVSEMGCFLPDKVAWEFGVEYAGVVIFGTATIVEDDQDAHYLVGRAFTLSENGTLPYISLRSYTQAC